MHWLNAGTSDTRKGDAPFGRGYRASTVVSSLVVLSAGFASCSFEVTEALLVIVPAALASGTTLIAMLELLPLASVPTWQVTVPDDSPQVPWDGVAETKLTPAGRVSVTVTPPAFAGPLLAAFTL